VQVARDNARNGKMPNPIQKLIYCLFFTKKAGVVIHLLYNFAV
jgi:hypothetical protein